GTDVRSFSSGHNSNPNFVDRHNTDVGPVSNHRFARSPWTTRPKTLSSAPDLMLNPRSTSEPTPIELGYAMPAEWEPHEATWLGWPHSPTDWPGKLDTIRWVYGEIARKLSTGELVRILVNNRSQAKMASNYLRRAGCDLRRVEFIEHPTNRGWTRD